MPANGDRPAALRGGTRSAAPTVEWIDAHERFLALEHEWDELADRQQLPFLRHAWFAAWWEAFGSGRLLICALRRGGELGALFPLHTVRRQLVAPVNVHSPVFRPFARDADDLEAVIRAVLARREDLVVPALPADHPALGVLRRQSAASGRVDLVVPQHTSPIVETAGVADFDATLGRKTRQELGRLRRKMQRERDVQLSLVSRPDDLEQELQRGLELEASGWKGARGTAVLSSPATTAFYRGIARAFHAEDRVRFSTVTLDGELAAFDFCILDHDRLYGLKFGYDEDFRSYGPGFVLQHAAIKRCCELGLQAYELLGAADEYKLRFSTTAREHYALRSYGRRPASLARYGYRRAVRPILRQAYGRLVPTRPGRRTRGRESA